MGCASVKDMHVYVPSLQTARQTNVKEFDQMFLLLGANLKECDILKMNLNAQKVNMINITKSHLKNEPKLIDAYTLFMLFVSICNRGESQRKGVSLKVSSERGFEYDLGQCSDVRLHWFAMIFNDFILTMNECKIVLPELRMRLNSQYDKLRQMRENLQHYVSNLEYVDKMTAQGRIDSNLLSAGRSIAQLSDFKKQLIEYEQDVLEIEFQNEQLKQSIDKYGLRIFKDMSDQLIEEDDKIRIRKVNGIVYFYSPKKPRTSEEEQFYYNKKLERSKERPHQKLDDEQSTFNFRWIGCIPIDLKLSEFQSILQEHHNYVNQLKTVRNQIRLCTNSYILKYDHISEGWRIFCMAAGSSLNQLENESEEYHKSLIRCKMQSNEIEQIKVLNKLLNNQNYFISYLQLTQSSKIRLMERDWDKFLDQSELSIQEWIQGKFLKNKNFRTINVHNQYNVLTNLSKCIYSLRDYIPQARLVHQKFIKFVKESQEFYQTMNKIQQQHIDNQGMSLGDAINQLQGERREEDTIKKKLKKLQKYR